MLRPFSNFKIFIFGKQLYEIEFCSATIYSSLRIRFTSKCKSRVSTKKKCENLCLCSILILYHNTIAITCCASTQLVVSYSSIIQPLLFLIFQGNLLFILLCVCNAMMIKIKLLHLFSNKMRHLDDHIMRLLYNL